MYVPNDFIECITDNPQYQKIMYYPELVTDYQLDDDTYYDYYYEDSD